jgi:hypothetical protein
VLSLPLLRPYLLADVRMSSPDHRIDGRPRTEGWCLCGDESTGNRRAHDARTRGCVCAAAECCIYHKPRKFDESSSESEASGDEGGARRRRKEKKEQTEECSCPPDDTFLVPGAAGAPGQPTPPPPPGTLRKRTVRGHATQQRRR